MGMNEQWLTWVERVSVVKTGTKSSSRGQRNHMVLELLSPELRVFEFGKRPSESYSLTRFNLWCCSRCNDLWSEESQSSCTEGGLLGLKLLIHWKQASWTDLSLPSGRKECQAILSSDLEVWQKECRIWINRSAVHFWECQWTVFRLICLTLLLVCRLPIVFMFSKVRARLHLIVRRHNTVYRWLIISMLRHNYAIYKALESCWNIYTYAFHIKVGV